MSTEGSQKLRDLLAMVEQRASEVRRTLEARAAKECAPVQVSDDWREEVAASIRFHWETATGTSLLDRMGGITAALLAAADPQEDEDNEPPA